MNENDVFSAIAHPKRRQILDRLRGEDLTVKALAGQFDVSRPAISQHLGVLRQAGLVSSRQEGRESYYHLEPDALREVERWLRHYERFWDEKLENLGEYLQRQHGDAT